MKMNDYFLASKEVESEQTDWYLRIILANFAGIELKMTNVGDISHMPAEVLDFDWACTTTLKYFRLGSCSAVNGKTMRVIASRLAVMPDLTKVKFKNVRISVKTESE